MLKGMEVETRVDIVELKGRSDEGIDVVMERWRFEIKGTKTGHTYGV
jgi:hypothetical protein